MAKLRKVIEGQFFSGKNMENIYNTKILCILCIYCICILPVVPHKAVAEVSRIGNL